MWNCSFLLVSRGDEPLLLLEKFPHQSFLFFFTILTGTSIKIHFLIASGLTCSYQIACPWCIYWNRTWTPASVGQSFKVWSGHWILCSALIMAHAAMMVVSQRVLYRSKAMVNFYGTQALKMPSRVWPLSWPVAWMRWDRVSSFFKDTYMGHQSVPGF